MSLGKIVAALTRRGLTVAVAEAGTTGEVCARLCSVSGASRSFLGGVVAYANAAKTDLLGVPETLLREHGAVSRPVALAMASGVRQLLGADLGLANTGVAGPTGGTPWHPVGLFWLALVGPEGRELAEELRSDSPHRQENKRRATEMTLELLVRYLGLG